MGIEPWVKHEALVRKVASKYKKHIDVTSGVNYEDVVQEGLMCVYKVTKDYNSDKGAESTFYYAAINNAFYNIFVQNGNAHKRQINKNNAELKYDVYQHLEYKVNYEDKVICSKIMNKLDVVLNEKQKEVILRCIISDESHGDVGRDWGCSNQNVRRYQLQALDILREELCLL